jgi:hypothetical protein
VEDLKDLFSRPRARDDKTLSADGLEDLFAPRPADDSLVIDEADLAIPDEVVAPLLAETPQSLDLPDSVETAESVAMQESLELPESLEIPESPAMADSQEIPALSDTPMNTLLTTLSNDLRKLAADIHKMLDD